MISDLISKMAEGTDLTYDQMSSCMIEMLSGATADGENELFLEALTRKGESDDELLGMLDRMQEFSLRVRPRTQGIVIDMCGTGGDGLGTFNVSTAASFVVAAAGGAVAKHGNRSNSGAIGSADIFEHLGCDLDMGPEGIADMLHKHGICFMFAQKFHPAMKHVAPARRRLGVRTAFNLLGPLSNPARVRNQLVGVSSVPFLERLPMLLMKRGAQNVMTVRSDDGMDEFSTSAINRVVISGSGETITRSVDPEDLGLYRSSLRDIQVGTRQQALESFVGAINGTAGRAVVETTALNAAGGLMVAGVASGFEEAVPMALSAIDDGRAFRVLDGFIRDAGDISRLREVADG